MINKTVNKRSWIWSDLSASNCERLHLLREETRLRNWNCSLWVWARNIHNGTSYKGVNICKHLNILLIYLQPRLISQFGWQGAMLVTSGLILSCILFGCLMRPIKDAKNQVRQT